MDKLNRVIGCLIGGACGDALGYIIEFDKIKKIKKMYGLQGITNFELCSGGCEKEKTLIKIKDKRKIRFVTKKYYHYTYGHICKELLKKA